MNIRTKTGLFTILTLVLGIAIGFMLNELTDGKKQRRRTSRDFVTYLERVIQPEASQRDTLDTLLRNHEKVMNDLSARFRANMHATIDSLRNDLNNVLTAEQQERLSRHFEKSRHRWSKYGNRSDSTDGKDNKKPDR